MITISARFGTLVGPTTKNMYIREPNLEQIFCCWLPMPGISRFVLTSRWQQSRKWCVWVSAVCRYFWRFWRICGVEGFYSCANIQIFFKTENWNLLDVGFLDIFVQTDSPLHCCYCQGLCSWPTCPERQWQPSWLHFVRGILRALCRTQYWNLEKWKSYPLPGQCLGCWSKILEPFGLLWESISSLS